jgi:hypothetical protein
VAIGDVKAFYANSPISSLNKISTALGYRPRDKAAGELEFLVTY